MSANDDSQATVLPLRSKRREWYQLEDRHAALLVGRVVVILLAAAVAAAGLIDEMTTRDRELAVAMCAVALALHAGLWLAPARWQRSLLTAVDVGQMVDAVLILGLALVSGGGDSPALWLLPVAALAATVGLAVRAGVKSALLAAIVVGAVQAIDGGDRADSVGPLLATVAAVVIAGSLTHVNEREAGRRYDLTETLHTAALAFAKGTDTDDLVAAATHAAGELLPGWEVEVRLDGVAEEEAAWREDGTVHLRVPLAAHQRGEPEREFGAIHAERRQTRPVYLRARQEFEPLKTLAAGLSVALGREELVRQLEHLSRADPLTGLGNRRAFDETLTAELARARRAGTPVGLLVIDVDHFKAFNDRHGHQAGDDALMSVAGVLQREARAEDRACRVGGEEFAVLLPGADEAAAMAVAERIRRGVERLPAQEPITVSLGVASTTGDDDPDALFAQADSRLYAAKEAGRNRVVGVSPAR